uniref:uncharacterized protein LOC120332004 n=1 Tax=Styela clava TaxID=7725 RepID=UPI00193A58C9|nr:uncharacterized protein LOC120332004 [Styela clava]
MKQNCDKMFPKARLVARGFEESNLENIEKESPTCCKDSLRTVIAIVQQKRWQLKCIDIKTAFLQGEELKRNVYLMPPKETNCKEGIIWKLRKCVYGLTNASLKWYDRVRNFMLENGCKTTLADPARKTDLDARLTHLESEALQSKISQLLWISTQSRPDISFDTCILATNFKSATVKDLLRVNKVISKLKSNSVDLNFCNLGSDKDLKLVCFVDASFGNLTDGGSQAASLIFLVGEHQRCNLISWQSKRIKRVVKSSLAAETLAMSAGVDMASFVSSLYTEIMHRAINLEKLPIEIVTDNRSLHDAIKSIKQVQDRRLRIEVAMLKEMMSNKEITRIRWCNSEQPLADNLTKKGSSSSSLLDIIQCNELKNHVKFICPQGRYTYTGPYPGLS